MDCCETYDLIVVGSGPAGAAAALFAHRYGLKTLLLDKEVFPRDKTCGDALSARSLALLDELGLLGQVRRLPGAAIRKVVFGSPEGICAVIDLNRCDPPLEGWVIRREIFDHFLFEQARAVVDGCLEGFAVRELIWEGEQVVGVRGIQGGGRTAEFRGSLVLGCDGFSSMVARRTGLYRREGRHWMVALRCYHEKVAGLEDQIELHFADAVRPGYFWIFPAGEGWANIGIGMNGADLAKKNANLRQLLWQTIASPAFRDRFAQARPLEAPVGWNLPVASKQRRIHGNGFLLLGDAAGLIDPFTGEGIGNALYSARLAAATAAEAQKANDFSASFLRRYEERLWAELGGELKTSARLHALGRRRWLLNLVIRRVAASAELGDLLGQMMASADRRRRLLNPLFYLGLMAKR